jgi:hypothetical protein
MKNLCVKLSGIGALLTCIPVIYRIDQGDIFNPASYFLWCALSLVCTFVYIHTKEGGHVIMAGYFLADLSVGIYAYIKSGKAHFGAFEWFVGFMTMACIALYVLCRLRKSMMPAVVASGGACIIAGIPLLVDTFRDPSGMSYSICWMYTALSVIAFWGGDTFQSRFVPTLSVFYWGAIIVRLVIATA